MTSIANTKATAVANADATPHLFNPPHLNGNYVRQAVATVEVTANDAANSIYRLARLRSSDRISSIGIANDALGTSAACKIGLLRTKADGGAVVQAGSDALFATGLSLVSAAASFSNQAWQNQDIANAEKRLWELLGLSADPGADYDLAVTVTNVGTTPGTVSAHITYVSGN